MFANSIRFLLLLVFIAFVSAQDLQMPPVAPQHARPPFHAIASDAPAAPRGFSPAQVRTLFRLAELKNNGAGQTIALIDAFDDAQIESDLLTFTNQFGLPACTSANGCFRKINLGADGTVPANENVRGWALETALDVEWAHAIAPEANLLLIEAASDYLGDLLPAVQRAVQEKATIISMSFGGNEFNEEASVETYFEQPGITFIASSGDSGYGVQYPAASSHVLAVGGTTVVSDATGHYNGEVAWAGSSGGLSRYLTEPYAQAFYQLTDNLSRQRGVPDVSFVGDPNTGFAVYDSVAFHNYAGWFQVGGTSAGAPQWAGLIAITNSLRAAASKGPIASSNGQDTLYAIYTTAADWPMDFHDILRGGNGLCGALCAAHTDYDYVTGLGTPVVPLLVRSLVRLP